MYCDICKVLGTLQKRCLGSPEGSVLAVTIIFPSFQTSFPYRLYLGEILLFE